MGTLKRMKWLPSKILEEIYYATIIPKATYCISIWGNCSETTLSLLEDNHARAVRSIYTLLSNLSNEESLERANWQPFSYLYKWRLLTLMQQVYHGTSDKSITQMFQKKDPEKLRTRSQMQFDMKWYNTSTRRDSFICKTASIWNYIPDQIKNTELTQTFKPNLKAVYQIRIGFTFQKGLTGFLSKKKEFTYH